MGKELVIPKINANDEFVKLIEWHFEDGDLVQKGEILAEFETSKANFELECEFEGYVQQLAKIDEDVAIGASIAILHNSKEEAANAPNPKKATSAKKPVTATEDKAGKSDRKSITKFSAKAKSLLEEYSINEEAFAGKGLVTAKQVLSYLKGVKTTAPANDQKQEQDYGLRSAPITKTKQFEITQLHDGQSGNLTSSLTIQFESAGMFKDPTDKLPAILHELSQLLKENPLFTSFCDGKSVHFYDKVDIGLALDLENDLKVPVMSDADHMAFHDVKTKINYFIDCYFDNKFAPKDLAEGTFTVTDLSGEGIMNFQPLINGKQSAILGVGGDNTAHNSPITLTLVFDHRILSGLAVSTFLNELRTRLINNYPKLPTVAAIACSRCMNDLESLMNEYKSESVMYVHADESGNQNYICHICAGNY